MALSRSTRLASSSSVLYGLIEALGRAFFFSRVLQLNFKNRLLGGIAPAALAFHCPGIDFVADGSFPNVFGRQKSRCHTILQQHSELLLSLIHI